MPGFSAHPPPVTLETPHSPLQLVSKPLSATGTQTASLYKAVMVSMTSMYLSLSQSFPYFLDKETPPKDKTCNRLVGFEPPKPFGRFLDLLWKKNSHFNSLFCNDCQGLTTHGIPVGTQPSYTDSVRKEMIERQSVEHWGQDDRGPPPVVKCIIAFPTWTWGCALGQ